MVFNFTQFEYWKFYNIPYDINNFEKINSLNFFLSHSFLPIYFHSIIYALSKTNPFDWMYHLTTQIKFSLCHFSCIFNLKRNKNFKNSETWLKNMYLNQFFYTDNVWIKKPSTFSLKLSFVYLCVCVCDKDYVEGSTRQLLPSLLAFEQIN